MLRFRCSSVAVGWISMTLGALEIRMEFHDFRCLSCGGALEQELHPVGGNLLVDRALNMHRFSLRAQGP